MSPRFLLLVTKKGSRRDYPCGHHIFLTSFFRNDPRQNESLQFCGSCLVSIVPRHVRFTQKEHKVVAERGCCVVKIEDLVVNKVAREWVSCEDFNNPNDE